MYGLYGFVRTKFKNISKIIIKNLKKEWGSSYGYNKRVNK